MKKELPPCGLYRTTKPLPDHEKDVPADVLVYFHNHSDSGLPVVVPPDHNILNRWHFHGAGIPFRGLAWADSAIAIDPSHILAREDEVTLAIELHDWPLAERHLLALQRVARGADAVMPFAHAARMASVRGDRAQARRLALEGERTVDSTKLTKHQAVYLGEAWSAAGDTARAFRWISAFTPRNDVHFQLHLHRDPWFVWLRDERYRSVLDTTNEPKI